MIKSDTGSWPLYFGTLDRKKMSKIELQGYESFNAQKTKCRNKKNKFYKSYGGKGLTVAYTAREFIGWWVFNYQFFKGKTPTVSRVDHDKGYTFNNIKLECVTVNSREAFLRNKINELHKINSKALIYISDTDPTDVIKFPSIREAARHYKCSQRLIQFMVRGKYKKSKKLNRMFYYEQTHNSTINDRKKRGKES